MEETLEEDCIALARRLVALDTRVGGDGVTRCITLLMERLFQGGFDVTLHRPLHARPVLEAHRAARGAAGRLVFYGHYDVADTVGDGWRSDPFLLCERAGRLHGLGAADNKVALAVRLVALGHLEPSPEIRWWIQGDEEDGAPAIRALFATRLQGLGATLYLEENGYQDADGTVRLLVRRVPAPGESDLPPDAALKRLIKRLGTLSRAAGRSHRVEVRGLNKGDVPGGCPFNQHLPPGARYLAIGVNDARSGIHHPDESVPLYTLALHARQLAEVARWVDETARGESPCQ